MKVNLSDRIPDINWRERIGLKRQYLKVRNEMYYFRGFLVHLLSTISVVLTITLSYKDGYVIDTIFAETVAVA